MERLIAAFPLLLLGLLAALTFWLEQTVQSPSAPRDGSARHDPDSIVENVVAVRMGPDGRPVHQLNAKRMLHYPDDDTTHLESPYFVKLDASKPSLSITSAKAVMSREGKTVDFNENVRAVRAASSSHSELVLRTEHLHVVPDDDYARTDLPVTLVDANTKVSAVGLELDNKAKTVRLLSNVRGSYVRPKK